MALNLENHPCFNHKVHREFGRVHLPVAPKCNIQCRYCNRQFDCVNESRPGVSCAVLRPAQAMAYLDRVMAGDKRISVVGIAEPGDPMANPEETLETLRLVRERYPEMLLCLASNGLALPPYAADIAALQVSHVTITMNAVDPEIGTKFYSWARDGIKVLRGMAAAERLIERQLESIRTLKERGVTVKINTIIAPGINDGHVAAVAEKAASLGADIFNAIPLYPVRGSEWGDRPAPTGRELADARKQAVKFIPQMFHCTRCRADAAGLLGEELTPARIVDLQEAMQIAPDDPARPYIAVASHEGMLVNQHLGEARQVWIFRRLGGTVDLLETRQTPPEGGGEARWEALAGLLKDCRALIAGGLGQSPRGVLEKNGLAVFEHEGLIKPALETIYAGRGSSLSVPPKRRCGEACSGNGGGCA